MFSNSQSIVETPSFEYNSVPSTIRRWNLNRGVYFMHIVSFFHRDTDKAIDTAVDDSGIR